MIKILENWIMNNVSHLDTSHNPDFFQTTIIGHFEQARTADNEASFLESKINQLEDQCEQFRETIRKDQIKYDETLTQVRLNPTQNPRSFNNIIDFKNDFSDNPKIRAARREVKDLKLKLRRVRDQTLKYQTVIPFELTEHQQNKINFAQTVSPHITNHLKHNFGNESDYKELICELKKQISSLDKRKVLANRILAMPIDDLYSDELLTSKAERSFLRLQQRFDLSSPTKVSVDIADLELELKNIIYQNDQRRCLLEKRKQGIKKMKKEQCNLNYYEMDTSSLKTPKKKLSKSLPNKVVGKEQVDSLNAIYINLKARAEKIDAKESETDRSIKEIEKMRYHMKNSYQEKMQIVSNLSSKFRDIQNIQIQIHALSEKNSQLRLSLNDIEDERSRIKRKESSLSSSKSKLLKQKSSMQSSKDSFIELQNKINVKEREISQRKREVDKMKEQIKKKTVELLLLSGRVELLENQVSQMISNTNLRENEIKQENTELSISMIEKNDQQQSTLDSFDIASDSFT